MQIQTCDLKIIFHLFFLALETQKDEKWRITWKIEGTVHHAFPFGAILACGTKKIEGHCDRVYSSTDGAWKLPLSGLIKNTISSKKCKYQTFFCKTYVVIDWMNRAKNILECCKLSTILSCDVCFLNYPLCFVHYCLNPRHWVSVSSNSSLHFIVFRPHF